MTPEEFVAWFDGYYEGHPSAPSKAEWDVIYGVCKDAVKYLHYSRTPPIFTGITDGICFKCGKVLTGDEKKPGGIHYCPN